MPEADGSGEQIRITNEDMAELLRLHPQVHTLLENIVLRRQLRELQKDKVKPPKAVTKH